MEGGRKEGKRKSQEGVSVCVRENIDGRKIKINHSVHAVETVVTYLLTKSCLGAALRSDCKL